MTIIRGSIRLRYAPAETGSRRFAPRAASGVSALRVTIAVLALLRAFLFGGDLLALKVAFAFGVGTRRSHAARLGTQCGRCDELLSRLDRQLFDGFRSTPNGIATSGSAITEACDFDLRKN